MTIINNIDPSFFDFNGIRYFKNFTSVVTGNNLRILNVYDSKIELLPLTKFDDITLNGVVHTSIANLQIALLPVIYSANIAILDGAIIQRTVTPTSTPLAGEIGKTYWYALTAGTYTNFGNVVVNANSLAVISRDDAGVFTVSQTAFDLSAYAKIVDSNKINTWTAKTYLQDAQVNHLGKDWVANAATISTDVPGISTKWVERLTAYTPKLDLFDTLIGKNKFNKATVINGFYISSSTGALLVNAPSILSNWMPIDATKIYFVSGRTTTGMRFRNASGTLLQPLNTNLVPVTNWQMTVNGSTSPNGILNCPPTAIEVQMVTTLSGNGDVNLVQLEEGILQTAYANYIESPIIKNNLIAEITESKFNELALKTDVNANALFKNLNLFDKTNVVEGYYINATTGALIANATSAVSSVIPIKFSTIYYLQGRITTYKEIVFYDIFNVKLKPYDAFGNLQSLFNIPTNNGAILSPPTAVSVQFSIKVADGATYDNIMFSESTAEKTYKPYNTYFLNKALFPEESSPVVLNDQVIKIVKETDKFKVRSIFNSTYDIRLDIVNNINANLAFNITSPKLVLKSEHDNEIGIVLNGGSTDDAAPSFFNNQTVGGNHGMPLKDILATAHGKTIADVGARYVDATGKYFVILKIIDANNISLGVENVGVAESWLYSSPTSPLTYSSNGNSTTAISFTTIVTNQLFPAVKNLVQKLMIDGNEKTINGTYYGKKINLIEIYNIVNYDDMITKFKTNRPVGGYLTQPNFTDGNTIVTVTNVFDIQQKGVITILSNWENIDNIILRRFGITQSTYSSPTWVTNFKRYFPNVLPITNNSVVYDFRLKPDIKTATFVGDINFTSAFWENGKATNRVVELLQSASLNVNFNLGYLPIGGVRSSMVNNAWYLTSNKKLYPQYIDDKIAVGGLVLPTIKQGVAFRGWSIPTGIRTNDFLVENSGKHYLYLDYHTIGTDIVELPSYLLGKSVTVIDKSSNVELLTTIVTGNIKVKITTSTPMYGYCELLIQ